MDILKEIWEANKKNDKNIVLCIKIIQEWLNEMSELVNENLEKDQCKQQALYNHDVQLCKFKQGDEVWT